MKKSQSLLDTGNDICKRHCHNDEKQENSVENTRRDNTRRKKIRLKINEEKIECNKIRERQRLKQPIQRENKILIWLNNLSTRRDFSEG